MVSIYLSFMVVISFIIVVVGILATREAKRNPQPPDYYAYYIFGIIFTGAGVTFMVTLETPAFMILGLVFLAIGLANKDKWDTEKWESRKKSKKKEMRKLKKS